MHYPSFLKEVDMDALKQLVHERLLFPVPEDAPQLYSSSSMSSGILLDGEAYNNRQGNNNLYDLRMSREFARRIVNRAKEGWDKKTCHYISLMYRTGLVLPQSRACHLIWEEIKNGYAPKIDGRVYRYQDMLSVLKTHWKYVCDTTLDKNWLYFQPQVNHFIQMLKTTFVTPVDRSFCVTQKPNYVMPHYEGIDVSLVYKTFGKEVQLYAAYGMVKERYLNFTVQALKSKGIPNTLPNLGDDQKSLLKEGPVDLSTERFGSAEYTNLQKQNARLLRKQERLLQTIDEDVSVIKQFGPYFIVTGTVTVNKRNIRRLKQQWPGANVVELIQNVFDQDIFNAADMEVPRLSERHPSVRFIRENKSRYRAANKFIESKRGKTIHKRSVAKYNAAQNLIDQYNEHQSIVDENKEERKRIGELDIFNHIDFIANDVYGYNQTVKRTNTPYEQVHSFLKTLGFTTTPYTVGKSVKQLETSADKVANKSYLQNGYLCRLYDKGFTLENSLNWIKFRR